ncbi:MAG: adenylate kinase family protein [Holosporales bacterium]
MRLVLIGPPGSGKGTQARFLSESLGIKILGMGDLLRREVKDKTPVGLQIQPILEKGEFPSSDLVIEVLFRHLEGLQDFLLDGFPRDLNQAEALDTFLAARHLPLTQVIFFRVDPRFLLTRLVARYTCAYCGAPYAKGIQEPRVEGVCDFCGETSFTQRPDDEESVAQERIIRAQARDKIVLEYYSKKGILHEVDGSLGIFDVREQIRSCLLPSDASC